MFRSLHPVGCGTLLAAALLAAAAPAAAQDAKPQTTQGVSVGSSSTLPMGPQIPKFEGYALRLRSIVLQPGATVGYHSHAGRPVVAYLVSGEYTEHRDGQGTITHRPGEQWVEGADVAHWSENRGAAAAVPINVDVLPVL